MDFTIKTYRRLLNAFQLMGYGFQTFEKFIVTGGYERTVVMRHDVDRLPDNALKLAELENEMGVQASYYFRIVPQTWDPVVIKQIVSLGHEVAYHYEDLTLSKGVYEQAIDHFTEQLSRFREFYPLKTICMHGSPMTKWDNRKLWEKYDYRNYGIIAEPYFDVDYTKVFYITDTGRSWNKTSVNVRDNVNSGFHIKIRSTTHMISLIQAGHMPEKIIINVHPQRWFNPGWGWMKELVMQNMKNVAKRMLVRNGHVLGQKGIAGGMRSSAAG